MQYWAYKKRLPRTKQKSTDIFFNGERQYLTINFLQMRIYVNP